MKNILQKIVAPIGTSLVLKKSLSIFAYVVVPIAGLTASLFFSSRGVFRQMGEWAQLGLVMILFMKPVAFVVPLHFLKRALTYRRQMGVAVFWLAFFHGAGFVVLYGLWSPGAFWGFENMLLYGAVALVSLLVLAATSNDVSVRLFRENWKRIQYLAYPTLFLVLLHSSLVKGEMTKVFVVGGAFLFLKYLERKQFRLNRFFPGIDRWGL